MADHSPLPWLADTISNDVFVRDANGHYVMFGEDGDISGADARFIVRAVNVHDDLVKALEWAMLRIGSEPRLIRGQNDAYVAAYAAAKSALAKAAS